jgi:hypothetical protein
MGLLDDLHRQLAIADALLQQGVLLYFTGQAPDRPQFTAHIADVNNGYEVLSPPWGFYGDSKVAAASEAARWAEQRGMDLRIEARAEWGWVGWPVVRGAEISTLSTLLNDLAARELKVEWWSAADAVGTRDQPRRWGGSPTSRHWVGIVYAPTGAVCEVGAGSTPIQVAGSVASRLGLPVR